MKSNNFPCHYEESWGRKLKDIQLPIKPTATRQASLLRSQCQTDVFFHAAAGFMTVSVTIARTMQKDPEIFL